MTGQRFGRLVVEQRVANDKSGNVRWQCRCDCGEIRSVLRQPLITGASVSCGCYWREVCATRSRTHGASMTRAYKAWAGMIGRCTNPKNDKWARYGGRGITVCDRWRDYGAFLSDMGERPKGMTVDRWPDNDGNYELGNCRWATRFNKRATAATTSWLRFLAYPSPQQKRHCGLDTTALRSRAACEADGRWNARQLRHLLQ